MKRILVATDFSTRSDRAIRRATLVAKELGASLSLVHVIDDDLPARIAEAEGTVASTLLDEQTQTLREVDGMDCEARVVEGDPFEGITKAAEEMAPDLLVIGPHRRQVLKDVFVGTTAERTIRASRWPVLMANAVPAGRHRHVLVAVDLSQTSGDAARAIKALGLAKTAALSVVYAFDPMAARLMSRTSVDEESAKAYVAEEQERASRELDAFLADLEIVAIQRFVKHNDTSAAHVIRATAKEVSADLVVVGTRGRTGIAKFLLGSVAQEVLRSADIDTLVVPPQSAD